MSKRHVSYEPIPEEFFTRDRLAKIDAALAEIKAGRLLTMSELEAQLKESRAKWLKENAR
ncbi:MAG: hypothetical protein QOJ65_2620 [Fimbriimonadaceae bacterium]|jgi:predicted transcriptional regulator|nr:hypothetical protein [Fimbriimonadaceae bacterium]